MNEKELNEEILKYKKINNRNSTILIVLFAILLIVCIGMIYVMFFS